MTLEGKMWNFPEGVSSVAPYEKYWKLIQQHLGVDADGIPGPKTALALLDRLGIRQPEQSWPSQEEVRSGKSVFGRAVMKAT